MTEENNNTGVEAFKNEIRDMMRIVHFVPREMACARFFNEIWSRGKSVMPFLEEVVKTALPSKDYVSFHENALSAAAKIYQANPDDDAADYLCRIIQFADAKQDLKNAALSVLPETRRILFQA